MDEQKKEQPTSNPGEGLQPATTSILEQAVFERQKLEQTLSEVKTERARNEEILAKQILGGRSEAGIQPAPVKVETAVEYAKRLRDGNY